MSKPVWSPLSAYRGGREMGVSEKEGVGKRERGKREVERKWEGEREEKRSGEQVGGKKRGKSGEVERK